MEHIGIIEKEIDEMISKNEFENALEYIERKMEESRDIRVISLCMYEKAKIEIITGKQPDGERDLSKSIDLLYYLNDKDFRGRMQMYIGGLYLYRGDVDNSLRMYKEAEKNLSPENYDYIRLLNNIGEVYKRIGEVKKALKNFRLCYKKSLQREYYKIGGYAAENIAEIYALKGNREKVEEHLENSLNLFDKAGEKRMINYVTLSLSILKNKRSNIEKLEKKMIETGYSHDVADSYYFFSDFAELSLRDYLLKEAILIFSELGDGHMREKAIEKLERRNNYMDE